MTPALEIEPYFSPRIKTLAQLRISCSPKSTLAPLALLSLPRDRHASLPADMADALLANGINGNAASPDSAADSPATPVDNSTSPDIKIDVDYVEHESDARNEPVSMKVDAVEDASVLPQAGSPPDPGENSLPAHLSISSYRVSATIPVEPPHGTPPPPPGELLEDVRMAEGQPTENGDVQMTNGDAKSPHVNGLSNGHEPAPANVSISLPAVSSSETAVDALAAASSPYPNNTTSEPDDDKPPPAKRARKHSDAERASLANVSTHVPCAPLRAC